MLRVVLSCCCLCFCKWFSSRSEKYRIITEWSNQYNVTKSKQSGRHVGLQKMGELGRSKILRMMQTDTWVQVYSFWGLINSTAAYKKLKNFLCSCTWRHSVIFGALGFIWFATIVLVLELLNLWTELLSAPCKFQHRDRYRLSRKTEKHQLSELFQE